MIGGAEVDENREEGMEIDGDERSSSSASSISITFDKVVVKAWDRFCWVCHTNQPKPGWKCQECVRVYHIRCCVDMPKFPKPKIHRPDDTADMTKVLLLECPECIVAKPNIDTCYPTLKNRSQADLTKILMHMGPPLRKAFKRNPYIDIKKSETEEYASTVAKIVDIQGLENMVQTGEIKTLEGFLGELKWIEHNSFIVDGRTSDQVKKAKFLFKEAVDEMKKAMECPDCYMSPKSKKDTSWFIKPCYPPHFLAWCKLHSYPWWPTKVKKISEGIVSVEFFGDQTIGKIPIDKVKIYSREGPPIMKGVEKHRALKAKAMQELEIHIQELEKVYGPVVFAENFDTPMIQELNEEGLRVMFPNTF